MNRKLFQAPLFHLNAFHLNVQLYFKMILTNTEQKFDICLYSIFDAYAI